MNEVLPNYERWREACQRFEQEYNMSSDDFMYKFEAGKLGDEQEFFDWYTAKRALDLYQENQEK